MFCSVFSVNIAVNTLALTVNASRVLIPFCLRLKQYLIQFQIVINKIFNLRTENGNNNSIARRNQTKMKWSIFRNKIHKIAIIPKKVRYTCCFYNCLDGFVYFLISFLFHTRIGALSLPVVFFCLFLSLPICAGCRHFYRDIFFLISWVGCIQFSIDSIIIVRTRLYLRFHPIKCTNDIHTFTRTADSQTENIKFSHVRSSATENYECMRALFLFLIVLPNSTKYLSHLNYGCIFVNTTRIRIWIE